MNKMSETSAFRARFRTGTQDLGTTNIQAADQPIVTNARALRVRVASQAHEEEDNFLVAEYWIEKMSRSTCKAYTQGSNIVYKAPTPINEIISISYGDQ